MNPLLIIDEVLMVLNILSASGHKSKADIYAVNDYMKGVTEPDKHAILNKLVKDGLIEVKQSIHEINKYPDGLQIYLITFEGVLFLKQGGYSGEKRRKTILTNLRLVETWLIAIGAAAAAVYYLTQLYWEHHWFH